MLSPKTLLLTAAAVFGTPAFSWSFTAWANAGYSGDEILYRSGNGLTNNMCVDLIQNNNRMSSFKFNKGTNAFCEMSLWDSHGCSGAKLGSSTSNWNVPNISPGNNDRVSSVWIDCL